MSKSRSPQVCEVCHGKAVVPQVVFSDQSEQIQFLSRTLPVLGYIIDRPCRFCQGPGVVSSNPDIDHIDRLESDDHTT